MRVKFSQTYKKNNGFIWGRLFSSSSLSSTDYENDFSFALSLSVELNSMIFVIFAEKYKE